MQGSSEEDDIVIEGALNRKHALESATKKASNRKWETVYVVVRPGSLTTYKDRKHFQKEPHKTFKATLDLRGFEADVPADYNTKKHNNVFRLRHASTGAEYLFETTNEVSFFLCQLSADCSD